MFAEKCVQLEVDLKWHKERIDDLKIDMDEYKRFTSKYTIPKVIAERIDDIEDEITDGIEYHKERYELESKILGVLKLGEGTIISVETDREVIKGKAIACNNSWLSLFDDTRTRDIYINSITDIKLILD